MNLIDKIVKKWYELPVIRFEGKINKTSFSFGGRISKRDSRNFRWYLERKELGFDERELWNLSNTLFDKFYLLHPEFNIENLDYTPFMSPEEREEVRETNFINNRSNDLRCYKTLMSNLDKYEDLIKWFYPRMKEYINNECPITIYLTKEKTKYLIYKPDRNGFMNNDDVVHYSNKCLTTMEKILKKEKTLPSERKELFLILNQFGW